MGQSPQYSYGAISGMDYSTLMNNPYLLAALQSPNVNFKANETSQTTNTTGAGLTTTAQTTASDGAIPVNYAIAEPDSSNTGLWVTGTIGAAALIACAAKGKGGNIIDGAKKIFGGLFKSSKKKAADVVSNKLQNIQVIKRGKTIECLVPGEKFTIKGNDKVLNHLNTYGINPKSITGLNEGETVLNGGVFNRKGYEITFEGNKITKILDKSGKDVTAQYFGRGVKLDDKKRNFISSAKAYIEKKQELGKGWAKGLKEMTVTRTVGDNVAHIQYRPKHSPVITQLTTNKPVKLTDDAVKSWLYEHPEEKVIAGTKAFKNFNAPAGMKVGNAKFTANGITYHFENGEIKGITKGGKYYAKGKKECNVVLAEKEESIKKAYDKIFNSDNLSDAIRKKFGINIKGVDMNSIEVNYVKA